MITDLIVRAFIKDGENVSDPRVRTSYGVLSSIVGIILNLLISIIKLCAGALSGSIAIVSDGFNNLSDAGSSVLNFIGFKLSAKKPHPEHPFGHGRIEYVTGLLISAVIMVLGVEVLRSSIEKIIAPQASTANWLTLSILVVSILIKLYIVSFNMKVGKKIGSQVIITVAKDSLMDVASTAAVLISVLVSAFTPLNIDGWCGALVSLLIIYVGFTSAKDTLSTLLGRTPDPEFVRQIQEIVLAHSEVTGIHDLVVHDYGPGRQMVTLHTEVPATGDILALHDAIDNIERELTQKLGCHATIHLDPISTDSAVTTQRRRVAEICRQLNAQITIHDFRVVSGPTHTNFIFDAVVPYTFGKDADDAAEKIRAAVTAQFPDTYVVLEVDRAYAQ